MFRRMSTALIAFSAACWASKQRSSKKTPERRMSSLARTRLLLARFNHSCGSLPAFRAGVINHLALPQSGVNHQGETVPVTLNIFWCDNHHIHCLADPRQMHVDFFCETAPVDVP